MKYLKLFEQLKDDVITNEYNLFVSKDEKYVILGRLGLNYESGHPSNEGEFTYANHALYYPVFPIEMLYDNMSKFSIDSLPHENYDFFLMIRESNINNVPTTPLRDGYEKMNLTIKDFKKVKYVEGVFLEKEPNFGL